MRQTPARRRKAPEKAHDIDRLASTVGLGKVRFTQLFKQVTGLPPHAFLLHAKVERARKLLLDSDMTVAQIAQRLALSSPRHLSTLFRETLGITPTECRARQLAVSRFLQ